MFGVIKVRIGICVLQKHREARLSTVIRKVCHKCKCINIRFIYKLVFKLGREVTELISTGELCIKCFHDRIGCKRKPFFIPTCFSGFRVACIDLFFPPSLAISQIQFQQNLGSQFILAHFQIHKIQASF